MTIRAKFKCTRKIETASGYEVELEPVTDGSEDNDQFYKWTPYGDAKLGLVKPETAARFEVGREYYVDFTPAE